MTRSRFAQTVGEEIRSQLAESVPGAIDLLAADLLSNYFERELKRLGMKSVGSAGAGSQTEVQRG